MQVMEQEAAQIHEEADRKHSGRHLTASAEGTATAEETRLLFAAASGGTLETSSQDQATHAIFCFVFILFFHCCVSMRLEVYFLFFFFGGEHRNCGL